MSVPDLNQPIPDRGHEALRQAVAAAIARVDARLEEIADLLSALNIRGDANEVRDDTAQADVDLLQEQVVALTERVEELEAMPARAAAGAESAPAAPPAPHPAPQPQPGPGGPSSTPPRSTTP